MLQKFDEEERAFGRSLRKAQRLQLSSPALSPVENSCPDANLKERKSVTIPFNMAQLEQDGAAKCAAKKVTSPPSSSYGANQVAQEAS